MNLLFIKNFIKRRKFEYIFTKYDYDIYGYIIGHIDLYYKDEYIGSCWVDIYDDYDELPIIFYYDFSLFKGSFTKISENHAKKLLKKSILKNERFNKFELLGIAFNF